MAERWLVPYGSDGGERLAEWLSSDASPHLEAVTGVAGATRRLIQALMSSSASPGQLEEAAALVEQATALVDGAEQARPYVGFAESSMAGEERAFLAYSPLAGPANPLAPPLVLDVQDQKVIAHAVLGDAYEGPPGCVHGGYVAAAFDEVLGFTMSFTGVIGMTGRLVVRYRRPTPLHTDLRFEAKVDRMDGRKIFTSAKLWADEVLTADAEGLFIEVAPEVFRQLMEARARPEPPA